MPDVMYSANRPLVPSGTCPSFFLFSKWDTDSRSPACTARDRQTPPVPEVGLWSSLAGRALQHLSRNVMTELSLCWAQ